MFLRRITSVVAAGVAVLLTATIAAQPAEAASPGSWYYLTNGTTGGQADITFAYGKADDVVLVGDWNGDGKDTLGVRRGNEYFLTNGTTGGQADISFAYGKADDTVLVGDWNGDGKDTLGVRRGSQYFLTNGTAGGQADISFAYGKPDDTVLVGDWNADGKDTLGVRRGSQYFLTNGTTGGQADVSFAYGKADDIVLVGDWNGDGNDTLGVRRATAPDSLRTGADVSWPQATGPYPSGMAFGIVGVNKGNALGTNPNLADEIAWAKATAGTSVQPKVQLYVATGNPGTAATSWPASNQYPAGTAVSNPLGTCAGAVDAACSWMYGYARAYDDATSRDVTTPGSYRWWLDVESSFTYLTSTTANYQALNRASLEGMTAYFQKIGATVGLYAPPSHFSEHIGTVPSTSPLYGLPSWIPVGVAPIATAKAACGGIPLTGGGTIVMTQYVVGTIQSGQDYDWSCS